MKILAFACKSASIAEDLLPVNFTKIVPLRILADRNCL